MPKRKVRCESCNKLKDDVVLGIDPYALDIQGIDIKIKLCHECYCARVSDI